MLRFEQEIGTSAALGGRAGDTQFAQFRAGRVRFETIREIVVEVAKGAASLLIVASRLVRSPDGQFDIATQGNTVLFEQRRYLLPAALLQQRVRIDQMRIAD